MGSKCLLPAESDLERRKVLERMAGTHPMPELCADTRHNTQRDRLTAPRKSSPGARRELCDCLHACEPSEQTRPETGGR